MVIGDSDGQEVPQEEHVKGEEMRTEPGVEELSGGGGQCGSPGEDSGPGRCTGSLSYFRFYGERKMFLEEQ